MAFHAVTIGDKTHSLEPTKAFKTTSAWNFTPHYTSHTVALNGFHSVLDFGHVPEVFKELDVALPTDVTLIWFKMMDDESYLLQLQSPSEEHISAIKNKRNDLHHLSITCMEWSISLQNNLIFVAKLSKDRKQPHTQIVITPESKTKAPTVDSQKKPVVDASGFQTATQNRNSRNKSKASGAEHKEEQVSLGIPVSVKVRERGNAFNALAKSQDAMEEELRMEAEADAEKEALTQEQEKQKQALDEEKAAATAKRLRKHKKATSEKKANIAKQFKTLNHSLGQKLSKSSKVSAEHASLIDAYLEPIFQADSGSYENVIGNMEAILKMEDAEVLATLSRTGTDSSLGSNESRKRARQLNYNESSSSAVETDASMSDGDKGNEDTDDSPAATVVEKPLGRPPDVDPAQRGVSDFFNPITSPPCLNTPTT
jgi:hypothetical protein